MNAVSKLHMGKELSYREMEAPDFLYGLPTEQDGPLKTFATKLREIRAEHEREMDSRAIDELFMYLQTDPQKFVDLISSPETETSYAYKPVFAKYPADEAGQALVALSPENIVRVARGFIRRYQRVVNIADSLGSEVENLSGLASYLRGVLPGISSSLKKATIEQLIGQVDQAVAKMNRSAAK